MHYNEVDHQTLVENYKETLPPPAPHRVKTVSDGVGTNEVKEKLFVAFLNSFFFLIPGSYRSEKRRTWAS